MHVQYHLIYGTLSIGSAPASLALSCMCIELRHTDTLPSMLYSSVFLPLKFALKVKVNTLAFAFNMQVLYKPLENGEIYDLSLMAESKGQSRSMCPIACTLDIVGDRWTLIVVRDLFGGKTRFKEFTDSPEKIPTNILSERLKRLESYGIIDRHSYSPNSRWVEYRLAKKGRDLLPLLQEMCRWGNKHIRDTWVPPPSFMGKKA